MRLNRLAGLAAGSTTFFFPGADSAACQLDTVEVSIAAAADVQSLQDALNCTGRGYFDVSWSGSLQLEETVAVSDDKIVSIAGVGYPTIQAALNDSDAGGTSAVQSYGTTTGIFSVSGGSALSLTQLVLDGGSLESGGAVAVSSLSSLNVTDCVFSNNNALEGGAIYATNSAVHIDGTTAFVQNYAESGGGAIYAIDSAVHIDGDATFSGNSAVYGGGILALDSTLHVDGNASFYQNFATDSGGGLLAANSTVHMDGATWMYANSAFIGGAIRALDATLHIGGYTLLSNNLALDGGAMYASFGSAVFMNGDMLVANNTAIDNGGGMYINASEVEIEGSISFWNNTAALNAGGMFAGYSVVRFNGVNSFHHNSANVSGGAVVAFGASSVEIDGETHFFDNSAGTLGGGIVAHGFSYVRIGGESRFSDNSAAVNGGGISAFDSTVHIDGNTSFSQNSAGLSGGALAGLGSEILVEGSTTFAHNVGMEYAGAFYCVACTVSVSSNTSFTKNSATERGGAMFITESKLLINGSTSFVNNSAIEAGGALFFSEAEVLISGTMSFANNSAVQYGGGLNMTTFIWRLLQLSGLYISKNSTVRFVGASSFSSAFADLAGGVSGADTWMDGLDGSSVFSYNSADYGGAMFATESDVFIDGTILFAYNAAGLYGGAVSGLEMSLYVDGSTSFTNSLATSSDGGGIGGISFIGNSASAHGGAIALTRPDAFNASGGNFFWNNAAFGGAISLVFTDVTEDEGFTDDRRAEFDDCQFHGNNASFGGASYMDTRSQQVSIRNSSFRENMAVELGGALYSAGHLDITDAVFSGNTAGGDGLAIYNLEAVILLSNMSFDGNYITCPVGEYSDSLDLTTEDEDAAGRFELVCANCPIEYARNLSAVSMASDTTPVCEAIPRGVHPSSPRATLATLDLEKGYFRVSSESRVILECYQEDACTGGTNAADYCATGYTGPYCAVCGEDTAPGAMKLCHTCSGTAVKSGLAFFTVVAVLAVVVGVFVVSHLVKVVGDDEGRDAGDEQRVWWRRSPHYWHSRLSQSFPLSAFRILVVAIQIVTQFTETAGTVYPDEYEEFLAKLAFVNVDIGFMLSSSCIYITSFYDRLLLATLWPIVALLALAGTYGVAVKKNKSSAAAVTVVRRKHLSTALFLAFFIYSSVSFTVFQTFVCDELDNGEVYLRADYSLSCSTRTHAAYWVYAIVMVCAYPIGIPLFFGYWLLNNKRYLVKSTRDTTEHLKPFRDLWEAYTPSRYHYEIVEYTRRIAITAAAAFVLPGSAAQIAVVLFLAIVFTFVSESLSPFNIPLDMWLYRWGNGIIMGSMYVALLLKVDVTEDGTRGLLVASVLLISANVFMIVAVFVQSVLLVRKLLASESARGVAPRP